MPENYTYDIACTGLAASGAVSLGISSLTVGICGVAKVSEQWTKAATIAAGGLSGGVTSTMAGGSFWEGVCNGLICAGLNHAMHLVAEGGSPDDPPGGKRTIKKASSLSPEENLEVAGGVTTVGGLWVAIESERHYSELFKRWMDKNGKIHDFSFHGNKYTGGMNSFGKALNIKYTNLGRVTGGIGTLISVRQCVTSTDFDSQLEYGFDAFVGAAGTLAPGIFGIPSTLWFWGGKQATYWYNSTTITPMIENGINPGLMINQPFK